MEKHKMRVDPFLLRSGTNWLLFFLYIFFAIILPVVFLYKGSDYAGYMQTGGASSIVVNALFVGMLILFFLEFVRFPRKNEAAVKVIMVFTAELILIWIVEKNFYNILALAGLLNSLSIWLFICYGTLRSTAKSLQQNAKKKFTALFNFFLCTAFYFVLVYALLKLYDTVNQADLSDWLFVAGAVVLTTIGYARIRNLSHQSQPVI